MGVVIVEGVVALRRLLVAASADDVAALSASMGVASASATAAFAPYEWRGHDYLAKMVHDCDFVVEIPNAVRRAQRSARDSQHLSALFAPALPRTPLTTVRSPLSSISLAKVALLDLPLSHLTLNPLFAQTPLPLAPRSPAMPPIAEFLINACVRRARRARARARKHHDANFQSRPLRADALPRAAR